MRSAVGFRAVSSGETPGPLRPSLPLAHEAHELVVAGTGILCLSSPRMIGPAIASSSGARPADTSFCMELRISAGARLATAHEARHRRCRRRTRAPRRSPRPGSAGSARRRAPRRAGRRALRLRGRQVRGTRACPRAARSRRRARVRRSPLREARTRHVRDRPARRAGTASSDGCAPALHARTRREWRRRRCSGTARVRSRDGRRRSEAGSPHSRRSVRCGAELERRAQRSHFRRHPQDVDAPWSSSDAAGTSTSKSPRTALSTVRRPS